MKRLFASTLGLLAAVTVLHVAGQAVAQSNGAIDLFDNQDKMKQTSVQIGDGDRKPAIEGSSTWDGSTPNRMDGGITLKYERRGSAVLVPARIRRKKVYFVFDTGATYTTLAGSVAKKLGIYPKKGYPKTVVQTANGPSATQFGIIDKLVLGGRLHAGVTYSVCDNCPSGVYHDRPVVGLLGLNVIGRYHASFDDAHGVIELVPGAGYSDRTRDVQPWVSIKIGRGPAKRGFQGVATIRNNGPRTVDEIAVRFICADGTTATTKGARVSAHETVKVSTNVDTMKCGHLTAKIARTRW